MSNAIVITEFGGPEVLQWRAVQPRSPQQGEVLIRVKAAGVGPTDLHIRAGHLAAVFPQRPGDVLGFEAAGVVEAVGEGADAQVGDEVAALLLAQGGYGELVTASVWYPKPAGVTWEAAAALPAAAEAAVGAYRAPDALAITMPLLASGELRLKERRSLPIRDAAEAHRLLESGDTHDKIVLTFE